MKNMEEIRRALLADPAVQVALPILRRLEDFQTVLSLGDLLPRRFKLEELARVLRNLENSYSRRDSVGWALAGAQFVTYLERWPELYGVERITIPKYGAN
jgi:hypothetical protein